MPDQLLQALMAKENEPQRNRLRELWDQPTAKQRTILPNKETVTLPDMGRVTIPRPPQFQPEPQAVGSDIAQAVHSLLRFAPSLQGMVGKVQRDPTADSIRELERSNAQAIKSKSGNIFDSTSGMPETNLLGLTNMKTGNITLNSRLGQFDADGIGSMPETLAHEVTHAAGHNSEDNPNEASKLLRIMLFNASQGPR